MQVSEQQLSNNASPSIKDDPLFKMLTEHFFQQIIEKAEAEPKKKKGRKKKPA